ncbi:MAG: hypothetical protein ACK4NC_05740 [Candidatus Gracilibacteria bacterium]
MISFLKRGAAVTLALMLISSCGSGLQSNLVEDQITPKKSLQVTSSPAVTVSSCKPVVITSFKNIRDFMVGPISYSLLGVEFFDSRPIPPEYMASLQNDAFCIKEDPGVDDGQFVYLMSADNKLLNGKIIQDGFAKSTKDIDYVYKSYFQNLQQEADTNNTGYWNPDFKVQRAPQSVNQNVNAPITSNGSTDLSVLTNTQKSPQQTETPETSSTKAYSVILPQQAKANIGATVVLRMKVSSVGQGKNVFYLNSDKDYASSVNVAGVIALPAKDLTLQDVVKADKNLIGKYVEMTGTIRNIEGKMQLIVTEGKNIRLVQM